MADRRNILLTFKIVLSFKMTIKCFYSFELLSLIFVHFGYTLKDNRAFLVSQMVKNLPVMQETRVQSLGQEDTLERRIANHSSILAWKVP